MTTRLNRRIASHTLPKESTREVRVRQWAALRSILGYLQMLGAALALGLIVQFGFTPLTLTAVLITGVVTGISMLLFRCGSSINFPAGDRVRRRDDNFSRSYSIPAASIAGGIGRRRFMLLVRRPN